MNIRSLTTAAQIAVSLMFAVSDVAGQAMPAHGTVPPDTALFAYDRDQPLEVITGVSSDNTGYRKTDISWASPDGGRVPAWLYVPNDRGPLSAIILQHGMPGTRNTLHDLAEAYVRSGAVVLVPTAPFSRPETLYRDRGLFTLPIFDGGDRLEFGQTVKDLQRAVDLLQTRADVDPGRIAFVGISYGAWAGAVLSGLEHRIVAYGLMVAPTSLGERLTRDNDGIEAQQFQSLDQDRRAAWLRTMASLDGRHFVSKAAPAHIRFDIARHDALVPLDDALALANAASNPKVIAQWETGHALAPQVFSAQAHWLAPFLGIDTAAFVPPDFREQPGR